MIVLPKESILLGLMLYSNLEKISCLSPTCHVLKAFVEKRYAFNTAWRAFNASSSLNANIWKAN